MYSKGTYLIKNLKTGHVYIGSSVFIELRIQEHFDLLEVGKHYNKLLQKAYNTDKAFFIWGIHTLFHPTTPRDKIYEAEQELMDRIVNKYNILLGAKDHITGDRTRSRQIKLNL